MTGFVWTLPADGTPARWEAGGGNGSSSTPTVRGPFSFAFDTPGLTAGVTVYTPIVDDILLDAWLEVDTAFNGTTPLADLGSFSGNTGLWGYIAPPAGWKLDVAGSATGAGTGLFVGAGPNGDRQGLSLSQLCANIGEPIVPARFTTTAPLKLVVSQTGQKGGTAVGGSAGAARLYIVTATPAPL